MVRAPSIITIILMTGNLEAYYTDRKEYRKKYLGNMAKTYLNFQEVMLRLQDKTDPILFCDRLNGKFTKVLGDFSAFRLSTESEMLKKGMNGKNCGISVWIAYRKNIGLTCFISTQVEASFSIFRNHQYGC